MPVPWAQGGVTQCEPLPILSPSAPSGMALCCLGWAGRGEWLRLCLMETERSWNHQCQGRVPHATWWRGGLARRGTVWWSCSPPDTALDSGAGLLCRRDLGFCTDSQHFLPFSHLLEHLWTMGTCAAPILPAAPKTSLPHLAAGLGGTYGIWWPGSLWDQVPPALSHSPPQTTPAPQAWSSGALT